MNVPRLVRSCAGGLMILATLLLSRTHAADVIDRAKVDKLAAPLTESGWVYGLAIGLINEQGTQTLSYGHTSESNPAPPTPETLFEIGSITKVFTGTILAQLVEEGKLSLDDPAQQHLGTTMFVPKGKERQITLKDLSTHSSGLPRMPSNFSPKDPSNPYADYTVAQMGAFLMKHKLQRQPGEKSEYSNLGVGLLGHVLQLKSGFDYESLVEAKIGGPLGMSHTRITLDDADREHLAIGHDYDGQPVANWDLPTLAGAGAIRSTTGDMLKFLAAQLGLQKSALDAAIAKSHEVHFKNPEDADSDVGLGWMLNRKDGVIWHNGGTGGYSSFAGFQPEKKFGVVVLANTSTRFADQLGLKLLKLMGGEEVEPLEVPAVVALASEKLEPLVGKYKLTEALVANVTREGDRLFVQLTGQPKIGIYATSETNFYCRPVDAKFDFELDDSGQAARMMIHQNGLDLPATRVDPAAEPAAGATKTPAG